MNSEDIRARIAALEAEAEARARARATSEADRWEQAWTRRSPGTDAGESEDAGPVPMDDESPWPFDFLFDQGRSGPATPGREGFPEDPSINEWLVMGLRTLRGYARAAGLDEEFWHHMRAAEREFLLAWRTLIDARLRRLEQRAEGAEAGAASRGSHHSSGRQPEQIEVEFD